VAKRTIHTLDLESFRKLKADHERLAGIVQNLRRDVAGLANRQLAPIPWEFGHANAQIDEETSGTIDLMSLDSSGARDDISYDVTAHDYLDLGIEANARAQIRRHRRTGKLVFRAEPPDPPVLMLFGRHYHSAGSLGQSEFDNTYDGQIKWSWDAGPGTASTSDARAAVDIHSPSSWGDAGFTCEPGCWTFHWCGTYKLNDSSFSYNDDFYDTAQTSVADAHQHDYDKRDLHNDLLVTLEMTLQRRASASDSWANIATVSQPLSFGLLSNTYGYNNSHSFTGFTLDVFTSQQQCRQLHGMTVHVGTAPVVTVTSGHLLAQRHMSYEA